MKNFINCLKDIKSPGAAILFGYYGMQNTGDDAFLSVTARAVNKYFRPNSIFAYGHRIPIIHTEGVKPLYPFPQLRVIERLNHFLEPIRLKQAGQLIWGGGSVIHTDSSNEYYCRAIDSVPRALSFAVGVSVGPFRNTKAEKSAARFLNRLSFIGVRDQISLERALGIAPNANVKLTFDLAPLLDIAKDKSQIRHATNRIGLGISLCNYERFVGGEIKKESERIKTVSEAIKACVKDGAIERVVLIDFNGHPQYGDHELHAELAYRISGSVKVEHVKYNEDPTKVIKRIGHLQGMLAMRLHAAVFAFCNSVPNVMLCYHEKCLEWGRMIGAPKEQTLDASHLNTKELAGQIEAILKPDVIYPAMKPIEAVERAMLNWTWLPNNLS
jgi:polysaccharide pyruvyl transferase WcaK-like protein